MSVELPDRGAQGGGWGPPGGYGPPGAPPPGGYGPPGAPPGGYGPPGAPPGGYGPPGGGGFQPPGGYAPPGGGGKPITGGKQTMALHAMTIDPTTGMPKGEKPPASPAAVLALVCGILMCLGPLTGIPAIVAGIIARKAAKRDPANVGGGGLAIAGIILGIVNLLGWTAYFFVAVLAMLLS
ncbi:MAG: DUF4190 domain-containing protein [Myxococcales bacterium]|nr:DUF4190 domain-containing protein [Myxococcales bacterium]